MPRIAEADGKLAGVVLLNGNERPLEDLALDEAQYREIKGRNWWSSRSRRRGSRS